MQSSLQPRDSQKLSYKYFGPFKVAAKVGKVAYKLQLPQESKIHDVFHVSLLKKFHGNIPVALHIPLWMQGCVTDELKPKAILDRRVVKHQNSARVQYLVQWDGFAVHESSWEDAIGFEQRFPSFLTS